MRRLVLSAPAGKTSRRRKMSLRAVDRGFDEAPERHECLPSVALSAVATAVLRI